MCIRDRRYGADAPKYLQKLDDELAVIKNMGYVDYFLIVWDFIHYAREHDIMVGPGRGSAAGSLVSYTTGITDIDPVRDVYKRQMTNSIVGKLTKTDDIAKRQETFLELIDKAETFWGNGADKATLDKVRELSLIHI